MLFKTNAAALKRVSVDVARKSRQAASIATELEQLLAERRARGAKHGKEPVEARDRAATLVNQLLREVRAAGVYAFREDPARQTLYRSVYAAQNRARRKRKMAVAANGATAPANGGAAPN